MWDKIKDYLVKAGTTIFVATLIIWALLNFGPTGFAEDMSQSFGAYVGKFLAPVFLPVGLGFWQITVALIAGISAKEVVVSSCAVLFGIVNASSAEGMQAFEQVLAGIGFTQLNAFCLMVFCLLYIPCAATLATIHKESGSWKWTGFITVFQLVVAWLVTFAVYQIGLACLGTPNVAGISVLIALVVAAWVAFAVRAILRRRHKKCEGCPLSSNCDKK